MNQNELRLQYEKESGYKAETLSGTSEQYVLWLESKLTTGKEKIKKRFALLEEKKKYIEENKEMFENLYKNGNYDNYSKIIAEQLYSKGIYSRATNRIDLVPSMNRLYESMYKKKVLKKLTQSSDYIKNCPECGGEMHRSHAQRSEPSKTYPQGQILYYRRITCQTCNHYESHSYKKPRSADREPYELTAIELDQIENRKANKYYPRKTTGFAHQRRTKKNK